jgi:hypothetical protein
VVIPATGVVPLLPVSSTLIETVAPTSPDPVSVRLGYA